MIVRVVDYVANPGGGCRFVAEMLGALRRVTNASFEVASHGRALEAYRRLLGDAVPIHDVPPANAFRVSPPWAGRPGARLLNLLLSTPDYSFEPTDAAFRGADAIWFPWIHRHRLRPEFADRITATLHDCITLEFPGIVGEKARRDEHDTLSAWLSSGARISVSSNATAGTIARIFGPTAARPHVIPLSSKHRRPAAAPPARAWPFSERPYLLCPTNITPHKNIDALLRAMAAWGAKVPLVLTGPGTDLRDLRSARVRQLLGVVGQACLVRDRDFFGLGYVSDRDYDALLDQAWALVMPTLAEGGGSFPVLEAMQQGIPVLSSDIPVMREMVDRTHGEVIWFDAREPSDIAAKLAAFSGRDADHRRRAIEQVPRLAIRSWDEVARDYARLMHLEIEDVPLPTS